MRPARYRWWVIGILFLVAFINFGDRSIIGTVGPLILKAFHFNASQYGLILGAFGFGVVGVELLLSGSLIRRFQPRGLVAGMMLLWSVLLGITVTATSVGVFVLWRVLFGMSEGSNWPAFESLIARWMAKDETARAFNVTWAGISMSGLVFPPVVVFLATRFTWRGPFIVLGVVGVIVTILFYWMITNYPEQNHHVTPTEREYIMTRRLVPRPVGQRYSWKRLLSSGSVWWAALGSFASAYTLYLISGWLAVYLTEIRHVPYSHVGFLLAAAFAGGILAAIISGVVSDRFYKKGRVHVARAVLPAISSIVGGIALLAVQVVSSLTLIMILVGLTTFFAQAVNGILGATAMDIGPHEPHMTGQIITGIGGVGGILAPLVTGFAVQATHSFNAAFLIAGGLSLVIGACMLILFRIHPVPLNPAQNEDLVVGK